MGGQEGVWQGGPRRAGGFSAASIIKRQLRKMRVKNNPSRSAAAIEDLTAENAENAEKSKGQIPAFLFLRVLRGESFPPTFGRAACFLSRDRR